MSQSLEPWSLGKFKVEPCGSAQYGVPSADASGVGSESFPPGGLLFLCPRPHQALADLLAECPKPLSPGFSFFLPPPLHLPSSPTRSPAVQLPSSCLIMTRPPFPFPVLSLPTLSALAASGVSHLSPSLLEDSYPVFALVGGLRRDH